MLDGMFIFWSHNQVTLSFFLMHLNSHHESGEQNVPLMCLCTSPTLVPMIRLYVLCSANQLTQIFTPPVTIISQKHSPEAFKQKYTMSTRLFTINLTLGYKKQCQQFLYLMLKMSWIKLIASLMNDKVKFLYKSMKYVPRFLFNLVYCRYLYTSSTHECQRYLKTSFIRSAIAEHRYKKECQDILDSCCMISNTPLFFFARIMLNQDVVIVGTVSVIFGSS